MNAKDNTYKLIIETAYKMFAEYGFEKTSLTMITKEIGITKPAIYYYFKSKQQLIDVIFEEICSAIEHQSVIPLEDITKENFNKALIAIGNQMIVDQEQDEYFGKIFNQYVLLASREERYMKRLYQLQEGYLHAFYNLLTHGVKLGVLSDIDIKAKAYMLGMVLDNIGNFMLMELELDYQDIWRVAVNGVLAGGDFGGANTYETN